MPVCSAAYSYFACVLTHVQEEKRGMFTRGEKGAAIQGCKGEGRNRERGGGRGRGEADGWGACACLFVFVVLCCVVLCCVVLYCVDCMGEWVYEPDIT